MASYPNGNYPVQNPYVNNQYNQQPVSNGMYNIPQYSYQNVNPNMYPQQQQQYLPLYQQQPQYLPFYQPQQQQQQYYQPTSNTFPYDAILFYDDYKPYYEFTNFAKISFTLDGHHWPTSEHYFQAQKFEGYPRIQNEIRFLPGARDAFEFVRKPEIKPFVRKDWADKKEEIMYKALKAKFSQNNDIRDKLLQTNNRMLVEDSPYDAYWGIGSDKTGKNRLGELLMKLRTELRTTPTHAPSVTTEPTRRRSSSVGRLSTPISSIIIDDKITYEANDSFNFLSNCYLANFKLDGKEWPTVLHYFVAKKFDLKKHHVSKILSLKSCEEVHLYSRNSSQSDIVTYWDIDKKGVMKKALKAKFEQNHLLRENILKTGRSEIIERSTNDQYWSQLANGSGRNVMGDLLCQVRDELNTRPSTPPNSFSTKWESFETKVSETISKVLPSSPKTPDPHSSSKRLSQPTNPSSYKFDNILADTTVNDLTSNLSRTEINNSNSTLKASDTIRFTDFVSTGVYHDFSTYSIHGFKLDGEYWKSVQHYFQAQKYSVKWLRDDVRFAATSKKANEIGKDKTNRKNIVKNWDSVQEEVMFIALKAKFLKHVTLRHSLLATGDRLIVNNSENEFWGCGKDGKGNNKLGMLLMRIRSECLNAVDSKPSLPTNHTNTSYPYSPTSPLKCASSPDVIEFFGDKSPYFEFTPYSRHSVSLDGIAWNTLNHYFQAQKFTSNNEKRKIKDAETPMRATYLANNELKRFSKTQTFAEKEIIMKRGLEAKFTQHPDLRRMLLDTGTRKLLFIHPEDVFWGIGTSKSKGKNKLGELLMNLRDKLRVPLPSTEPKFDPKNILHTNSYPCSSDDDNTTHQRDVKRQVSSPSKLYSTPPEVTPHRRSYFSILTILLLVITVLRQYFGM